jgi:hypothetical protein
MINIIRWDGNNIQDIIEFSPEAGICSIGNSLFINANVGAEENETLQVHIGQYLITKNNKNLYVSSYEHVAETIRNLHELPS